jgi:hypothetical protein
MRKPYEKPTVTPEGLTGVPRPIEDKIRKLSQQAVEEKDPAKAEVLLHQLREAIHAHIEKLRERMAKYPVLEQRRASGVELPDTVEE